MVRYAKGSEAAKAYMASIRPKKGAMSGGKLKGVGKSISRGLKHAFSPKAVKHAAHELGHVANMAKKYVPKDLVNMGMDAAITAGTAVIGQPELAPVAKRAGRAAVASAYKTNLRRGSVGKNFAKNMGRAFIAGDNMEGGLEGGAVGRRAPWGGSKRTVVHGGSVMRTGHQLLQGIDRMSGDFLNRSDDNIKHTSLSTGYVRHMSGSGIIPLGH